ncbi:hypothetical protein [Nocardia sp. R7R-8]|uniref:hypothetical protein n=1 Tax=Nocardia sp. R7R-8 TaxID=3459304 RepID=UPI00403DB3F7
MTQPQGAHLVGSINWPDAETTFRNAAKTLGSRLRRIPDGEVGERMQWISFQAGILAATPGLERAGGPPIFVGEHDISPVRIVEGTDPASIQLPALGYSAAAQRSWATFRRLRDEGVIPAGTRFQVSLPTPAAVVAAYIIPADRPRFEPVYRAALYRELDDILRAIPHTDLAIQWDTAVEFGFIETSAYEAISAENFPWFADVWGGVIERAVEQAALVPAAVDVGFHLCYGDVDEKHFVEPVDAGNLARFVEQLLAAATRPISWVHLPVPIERDDDEYFAPLSRLEIPAETEIYLGLVHRQDGPEGIARRSAAAARHLRRFGIATECGCGRAPADETLRLLELHTAAAAW